MTGPQAPPDPADGPLVSAVVVAFQSRRFLARCIDSLLAQTHPTEVIVVDNASTDGTAGWLRDTYPQVTLVAHPENVGFAAGNNLGIAEAQGELILLLNADAWLEDTGVAALVAERARRGLDLIGPREGHYETKVPLAPYWSQLDPWGHPVYRTGPSLGESFYLTGVCLLFPAELYAATGGLDDSYFMYCEEVDWCWRLNLSGRRLAYAEDTLVYHAVAGSSDPGLSAARFGWRNENTLRMLITNYGAARLAWVLPTLALGHLLEAAGMLAIRRADIAATYPRAWVSVIRDAPVLRRRRARAQEMRRLPDRALDDRMYRGVGKVAHLGEWLRRDRRGAAATTVDRDAFPA